MSALVPRHGPLAVWLLEWYCCLVGVFTIILVIHTIHKRSIIAGEHHKRVIGELGFIQRL